MRNSLLCYLSVWKRRRLHDSELYFKYHIISVRMGYREETDRTAHNSVKGESSGSKGPLSQLLWESIVSNNDGGAVVRMAVTILAH